MTETARELYEVLQRMSLEQFRDFWNSKEVKEIIENQRKQ